MRSFKLQATMMVKGVYTSDIAYASTTLPSGISLKVPKDKDWFSEYSWVQLPMTDTLTCQEVPRKVQTQTNFAKKEDMANNDL